MKQVLLKKVISIIMALAMIVSTSCVAVLVSNAYMPNSPTTVSGLWANGETTAFSFRGKAIKLGYSQSYVLSAFGTPICSLESGYGFNWQIFNAYDKYLQVGIKDGTVVALYSNNSTFRYYNISSQNVQYIQTGTTRANVRQCIGVDPIGTRFHVDTFVVGNTRINVYYNADVNDPECLSDTVKSIHAIDNSIASSFGNGFNTGSTYESAMLKTSQDLSALACHIFNSYRANNGLPPLIRSEAASNVAIAYSKDMHDRNFLSLFNPDGVFLRDLLSVAGVRYSNMELSIPNNPVSDPVHLVESLLYKSQGSEFLGTQYTHVGLGGHVLGGQNGFWTDGNVGYQTNTAYDWVFCFYTLPNQ